MKPLTIRGAGEPRFASLTAGLLARKGQAKPAMRPGGTLGGFAQDDLGWNDMGYAPAPQPLPEPVRQQAEIAAQLDVPQEAPVAAPALSQPADPVEMPAVDLPKLRQAAGGKAKAAFTLRLAAERHLRLRLACAVTHKSAQALVTQALDALLDSMPALDALAEACPADAAGKPSRS